MTPNEMVLAYCFLGALIGWKCEAFVPNANWAPWRKLLVFIAWPGIVLGVFFLILIDLWEWFAGVR